MKTDVEKLENNEVMLTVEVPAEQFKAAMDQAFKNISTKVVIPGFRKGKVPRQIIEQRVGADYVVEEAVNSSLPYFYAQAVSESGIIPIDKPNIEVAQAREGMPLIFKAKVEVQPEVKLGKYEGLEIERSPEEVTEEEVEGQLTMIQDRFGTLEESSKKTLSIGDFAVIDFKGTVDDEPVEGGSANDYLLEIGSGMFVPGIEDQMVGMKKDEIKDIWVDIPQDYAAEQIAGKRVKFEIALKDIKRKKLPEVDDDLAKQVGFERLDDLKNDLRGKIANAKKTSAEVEVRSAIIKKVTEDSDVDVPEVMVERKLDEMVADFARNLQAKGLSIEQYLEVSERSLEDLRESLRDDAQYQVRSGLVLEAIAEAEQLEVTEEEIDEEVAKLAEGIGQEPAEAKARLSASRALGLIADQILIRKTLETLIDKADIKVKVEGGSSTEKTEKKEAKKTGKTQGAKPVKKTEAKKTEVEKKTGEAEDEPAKSEKRDVE